MADHASSEKNFLLRKRILFFIHCVSFCLFVAAVCIIYDNGSLKRGLQRMDSEHYEDSLSFDNLFAEETEEMLRYVRYRDVFESAGEVDPDNPVFAYSDETGEEIIWTLGEVLSYANVHGYSFDNHFNVIRADNATDGDGQTYPVTWRAYRETKKATAPGAAFMTTDEIVKEVMLCLGEYYRSSERFNTGNSNFYYLLEIESRKAYSNRPGLTEEFARSLGKYVILKSDDLMPDNNLSKTPTAIRDLITAEIGSADAEYRVILAVDTAYPFRDNFYFGVLRYAEARSAYSFGLALLVLSGFFLLSTLSLLALYTGRKTRHGRDIVLSRFDRMMPEKRILLAIAACLSLIFLSDRTAVRLMHLLLPSSRLMFAEKMMTDCIIYACALPLILSLIRSMKANLLWQSSFLNRLLREANQLSEDITYAKRIAIYFLSFLAINLSASAAITVLSVVKTSLSAHLFAVLLLFFLLGTDLWFFKKLYKKRLEADLISEAIKKLNLETPDEASLLNISDFEGLEAKLAHTINNVNVNLQKALNDSVRSERMKAELITNVSHDIKTPLTSIINYIDLIKRAEHADPEILSYIHVLEKKSQHLKTLTEDLLEASKASSGNIQVNASDINFAELAEQTNGEFKERFSERGLSLISNLPSAPVYIHADGQHLWRVLENLYNNAFKYAARASRVYVDMRVEREQVFLTIKNISDKALNISPEELTERFVRGDASRTTEGSGLGLSIAKSLTELQKGELKIEIDGDYFKASVIFPVRHIS